MRISNMLRRSLAFNLRLLAFVALGPNPDPAYSERGAFAAIAETPALIDQRG